jgi:hypothetical protein
LQAVEDPAAGAFGGRSTGEFLGRSAEERRRVGGRVDPEPLCWVVGVRQTRMTGRSNRGSEVLDDQNKLVLTQVEGGVLVDKTCGQLPCRRCLPGDPPQHVCVAARTSPRASCASCSVKPFADASASSRHVAFPCSAGTTSCRAPQEGIPRRRLCRVQ